MHARKLFALILALGHDRQPRRLRSSAAATTAAAPAAKAGSAAKGSGVEDGVLTVAMECAYAPYNWSQSDDSNGAVPIKDSNEYANGYDVMMAKKLCEANGWKLEVVRLDWDSLIPAVQSGTVDAVIAGQSMTAKRMKQVDFAGPYLYATIVCLTRKNSKYAGAAKASPVLKAAPAPARWAPSGTTPACPRLTGPRSAPPPSPLPPC
jgi:putative lysine transport system substrate-binding protein